MRVVMLTLVMAACHQSAPIVRADDHAKTAPPPAPTVKSACGGYEGGKIGNHLVCLKLTKSGEVSPTTVDVGSPYNQKSDLECGGSLVLWGVSYAVTCAQIPTTEKWSVPSTDYALERDGVKIPLLRRLNADDGWWCTVRVVGDEAFLTFRFHKLD
jgi:hypothetical protein